MHLVACKSRYGGKHRAGNRSFLIASVPKISYSGIGLIYEKGLCASGGKHGVGIDEAHSDCVWWAVDVGDAPVALCGDRYAAGLLAQ